MSSSISKSSDISSSELDSGKSLYPKTPLSLPYKCSTGPLFPSKWSFYAKWPFKAGSVEWIEVHIKTSGTVLHLLLQPKFRFWGGVGVGEEWLQLCFRILTAVELQIIDYSHPPTRIRSSSWAAVGPDCSHSPLPRIRSWTVVTPPRIRG